MRAALAVLALQPARRRIAVLGDMLELGEDGPARARRRSRPRSPASADLLFTCGPLMRSPVRGGAATRMRGAHADDSAALAPIVAAALRAGRRGAGQGQPGQPHER